MAHTRNFAAATGALSAKAEGPAAAAAVVHGFGGGFGQSGDGGTVEAADGEGEVGRQVHQPMTASVMTDDWMRVFERCANRQ